MITVHHLENSRSQRVLRLLEELGLPYEVIRYERDPDTMLAPKSLRAVHTLGKSPIITENGTTVAETGAIVEYILDRHGEGRLVPPPGTPERLRYTFWLHYAEGSAMPPLVMKLVFSRIPLAVPALVRPLVRGIMQRVQQGFVDPNLALHLGYIDAELAATGWFAGPGFTAADIMKSFPAEAAANRADGDRYRNLAGFLARIHARPAYGRALERGGPYAYAPDAIKTSGPAPD